jgi:uncharacterized membrane protein HdeD (DUF308 family)
MHTMIGYWWALVLRGIFAIIFGLMALVWPGLTLAALVILFGVYSFADGVFALISAVQHRDRMGVLILEGLADLAAAAVTFLWPAITALALLYVIAAWAVVTGVMELIAAVRLRRAVENEILMGLSGVASIVFGALLFFRPGAGALAVSWLIGAYALLFGILLLALGLRMHELGRQPGSQPQEPGPTEGLGQHA